MNREELYHYGIMGMKWGHRKSQHHEEFSKFKKKRLTKKYDKLVEKSNREFSKKYNDIYIKSYNKAADHMNNGGIDRFNKQQEKRYGKKYYDRDGYEEAYSNLFQKRLDKILGESIIEYKNNDKYLKKAKKLIEKYEMNKWNDAVKFNEKRDDDLKKGKINLGIA